MDNAPISEDKQDVEAASREEITSSTLKGKKPMEEMVAGLGTIDEDGDNWDDDSQDEDEKILEDLRHEHLAISHIRRKQMAP